MYRFFTFQFEGNLHIEFLRGLLRNEVDFLGVRLTNVNLVSSSDQFTVHDVFQNTGNVPISVTKDGMLKTRIRKIVLRLSLEHMFLFDVISMYCSDQIRAL
mgnify:CR=1 FL=1